MIAMKQYNRTQNQKRFRGKRIESSMSPSVWFFIVLLLLFRQAAGRDLQWRGADVSALEQTEQAVEQIDLSFWYKGENTRSMPEILADSGVNLARLRLLHDPLDGINGLDYTLRLGERLTRAGIDGIMLNIHFSDKWVDRNYQEKPNAWKSLNFDNLEREVKKYTYDVMTRFIQKGIKVTSVQLGNEIEFGILWPEGKVDGSQNKWKQLGSLLRSARRGMRDAYSDAGNQNIPKIVLHVSGGTDKSGGRRFFDNLIQYFNGFQVIGVSYFPWIHGSIDELEQNLNSLASAYNKDIAVVETAYPWTLKWNDNTPNPVGEPSQLLDGFPATEAGQRHFLSLLRYKIAGLRDNRGLGLIYNDPDRIATWNVLGSWWENLALFEFGGGSLRALEIFAPGTPPPKKNANMDIEWHGCDASYLALTEDSGGKFAKPVPETFQDNGINIVRLRLFHTPIYEEGASGLEYTLDLAKRFHDKGMDILLAIHYSDTWADPEFQRKPKVWEGLGFSDLVNEVEEYTTNVLQKFIDSGIPVKAVQLGNEITTGMLYPDGRVGDEETEYNTPKQREENIYNTPKQWAQFRTLMRAAIRGAKAVTPTPKTIIHHSRSGDNAACRWFFDLLLKEGNIDFDIIGTSYYNWWDGNGPIVKFKENVEDLAERYRKDILLLETGYPWTMDPSINDSLNNTVRYDYQLLPFYPATKKGQWQYLLTLRNIMADIPKKRGLGMFYWEATWISAPDLKSKWENIALFDEKGRELPAFGALADKARFP